MAAQSATQVALQPLPPPDAAELHPQSFHRRPEHGPEPASSRGGSGLGKTAGAGIALLVLGAMAVGLLPTAEFGLSPAPTPIPAAIEQPVAQPSGGPSLIQPVLLPELQKAINGMVLSDSEKAQLRSEVAAGKTYVGWVTVSDSEAQDGDWITVSSAGFSQAVELFHRPTTIAVPYTPGVPVTVTGNVDGDGRGITVAVHVGTSIFRLAPMRVGTSVQVPTP